MCAAFGKTVDAGRRRRRMKSTMDRRLRRAPDAEWVLTYPLGLSRKRIAALVRVHPAAVGRNTHGSIKGFSNAQSGTRPR
jgi:hypothetical protein